MPADRFQDRLQPGEHIGEKSIRMLLGGIKNNIGKDGDDLFETGGFLQKSLVQPLHLREEANASHADLPLETALHKCIQAGILFRG